jgi:hypothetical protein
MKLLPTHIAATTLSFCLLTSLPVLSCITFCLSCTIPICTAVPTGFSDRPRVVVGRAITEFSLFVSGLILFARAIWGMSGKSSFFWGEAGLMLSGAVVAFFSGEASLPAGAPG